MVSRRILSACIALCVSTSIWAQDFVWPMAGKRAGDNVLCKPQSYIGTEHNFSDLFIGGEYGDAVVSPVSGKVVFVSALYRKSLEYAISVGGSGSFDQIIRDAVAEKIGNEKYVCGTISIMTADGRKVNISGLTGPKLFMTGQRVSTGDTLGFLAYSFKAFSEPSLILSISDARGKPTDPMSPFGLESTFKEPETLVREDPLPAEKCREDITVLEEAVLDAYPSLDALMSEEAFRASMDSIRRGITGPVSVSNGSFGLILRSFNKLVHDSHLYRLPDQHNTAANSSALYLPSFYYMWADDTLSVLATSKPMAKYCGKAVASVDGMSAAEYVQRAKAFESLYDGDVQSTVEESAVITGVYGMLLNIDATANTTSHVVFMDGTELDIPFVEVREIVLNADFRRINDWRSINYRRSEDDAWQAMELNDSTSCLSIRTFEMDDVQLGACLDYLYNCKSENLIVDLRNNAGGESRVLMKLLSALTDVPMKRQKGGFAMVKKQGHFQSFKYSLNYLPDEDMFTGFAGREGAEGFYSLDTLNTCSVILPDTTCSYGGRVYVLTNGHSYSAATLFPSVLVRNRRAVTVGRETGTAYHFMTAYKFADILLPNSLLVMRIPLVKCVFDSTVCERTPAGRGLLPDYPVPLTRNEVMMGEDGKTDVMLGYALSLIAEGKYLSDDDPFAALDSREPDGGGVNWLLILGGAGLAAAFLLYFALRRRKTQGRDTQR